MRNLLTFFQKRLKSSRLLNESILFTMSFILLFIGVMYEHSAYAQTNTLNTVSKIFISEGDTWFFMKGLEKPPRDWTSSSFDHSNWQSGPSGIGYGIGSNRTYLGDMKGNYSTVYARRAFTVDNLHSITGMTLSVVCNGPFIAYINGIEAIRTNTIQNSSTIQTSGIPQVENYDISGFVHELSPYDNILSIECSNDNIDSDNFSLIPVFEVLAREEVQQ